MICKYFLPFGKSLFHFVNYFFFCSETFQFDLTLLFVCAFFAFGFGVKDKKFITKIDIKELTTYNSF